MRYQISVGNISWVFRSVAVGKVCHQISGQTDLPQEDTPKEILFLPKCHTLLYFAFVSQTFKVDINSFKILKT